MTSETPTPIPFRKREEFHNVMPVSLYRPNSEYLGTVKDATPEQVEKKLLSAGVSPVRIMNFTDRECAIKFFGKAD